MRETFRNAESSVKLSSAGFPARQYSERRRNQGKCLNNDADPTLSKFANLKSEDRGISRLLRGKPIQILDITHDVGLNTKGRMHIAQPGQQSTQSKITGDIAST